MGNSDFDFNLLYSQQLGTLIRTTREELGWSREELAHRADMSDRNLARIETGSTTPLSSNVCKLEYVLNINVSKFNAEFIKRINWKHQF
ncbi:helix-turn-helix domain-containing protein [Aquibacillus sediminis]|uniref:helix-turn-helix domain-containing protein n=1 Tax=Aquibacillus sediminis TaxID=2574734 RepID=UPI001486DC22|nr:helix-turn-helix domain-containing protein [Aquibacillus sediminis]